MDKGKDYIVVHPFRDLQDKNKDFPNGKVYAVGDIYSNKQASKERLEGLSTKNNKIGKELIKSKSLDDLTVKELKDLAKDKEVEGYSNMKKEELVKLLAGE